MNLTSEINELKEEIKTKNITLEEIIKTKDNRINELERRVEDLEQYTRVEDVMITGLATKHRSYARVVAQEGGTGREEQGAERCLEALEASWTLRRNCKHWNGKWWSFLRVGECLFVAIA